MTTVHVSPQKGQQNPALLGMKCIRCEEDFPIADYFVGCPSCHSKGYPASVAPQYNAFPRSISSRNIPDWLVYSTAPSLGEGNTPLISMKRLADSTGVSTLRIKNETSNPTGSHKDRMSPLLVQRALDVGAATVVAASSGNAGVSLAAYAASAGLECVIITTRSMDPNWRRAAEMHGAVLHATNTDEERWTAVAEGVRLRSWYPATNFTTPAVGSNPFGVDGYRGIAFEIFAESKDAVPTDIIVPSSRADLLWGIARGFEDLVKAGLSDQMPKIHVVEPHPRLTKVLAGSDYRGEFPGESKLISIGGSTVTYQSLHALEIGAGTAVVADEFSALEDQKTLARHGLYLELSSASALTGLRILLGMGILNSDSHAVLIATSHGYKEHAVFDSPISIVGSKYSD
jgi:threonine synthase